jgi:hypothetical protein
MELQRGAFIEAQAFARQQIGIDYLDERAYRRLFEALARNGQRNQALTEYDKLCELLATELGIEPSEETQQLHVRLLCGEELPEVAAKEMEQAAVPELIRSIASPTGLPAFLAEEAGEKEERGVFVGRERELAGQYGLLDEALAGRGRVEGTHGLLIIEE